jgi:Na+(H+)/acetate symporter ActP
MITIKIIAMIWAVLMGLFWMVAKISGMGGVVGQMVVKLLSVITVMYFGYELFKMLP